MKRRRGRCRAVHNKAQAQAAAPPARRARPQRALQRRYNPRLMGKGDRRTKRGKIFQGTTGKRRPKRRKK